jgi:chromosome segregation ATPase
MPDKHPLAKLREDAARDTVRRIHAAMDKIEVEIRNSSDSVFERTKGKITLRTVCEIAGVGRSTLDQKHNRNLRNDVRDWLKRLSTKAPIRKTDAVAAQRETIAGYKRALEALAADVATYSLRADDAERRLAESEETINGLRAELNRLRQCGGTNVIPL